MPKRQRSPGPNSEDLVKDTKRQRVKATGFAPIKVATAESAARVDADPPYFRIQHLLQKGMPDPGKGRTVFYWMRMADLRINDNRALSFASARAQKDDIPLVAFFVLSPQDYVAHDRSPRRVDFVLRNLESLQSALHDLHIPLLVITHTPRKTLPTRVIDLLEEYGCRHLYANLEYEVDELRRDVQTWELGEKHGIQISLVHNKCIIEPGVVLTKQNKGYTVYSPYWKKWIETLNLNLDNHLDEAPCPSPNTKSIREDSNLSLLFQYPVPKTLNGFELEEKDAANMKKFWPAGESNAKQILEQFLRTKTGAAHSRVHKYHESRDQMDEETTSRLSAYLSSGVLSIRECIRQTMQLTGSTKVNNNTSTGIGRWIQELAWRDFYTDILAHFPRVSMGRPYQEKFSEVVWEEHQTLEGHAPEVMDVEELKRWKEGLTGVPIVDATMRCLREMGWVHNRGRMIAAMYLTKDLMIDWRVGEKYFMQNLIDGDLASNNGGWQWCASTGVDSCPYFRIFNPQAQSLKADPTGKFIRCWVPELQSLQGPGLHNPTPSVADKLGYPRILIDHKEARNRALRRFKNPGEQ